MEAPRYPKHTHQEARQSYRKPLLLLILGTMLPLAIGALLAWKGFKTPQCPSYETTMPDGSNCIIGANMSGLYMFFAVPFVVIFDATVIVWMLVIWRKHKSIS